MLLNGESEKLQKYSKVQYSAEKFINAVKEVWEYSDLQIRCVYLISDLAKKGNGVFSIAYSTFISMFEQRFKMKISLSSVKRFFGLMNKLGLVSRNEGKRKNNSQSANIFIIEKQLDGIKDDLPVETPSETHNTSFQEVDDKHKPLNKNIVKQDVDQSDKIFQLYLEYKKQGINKTVFNRVMAEVKNKRGIKNLVAYIKGALNNIVHKIEYKKGTKRYTSDKLQAFYDVLMGGE